HSPAMMAAAISARVHGWTTLDALTCPKGHRIKQDTVVLEHGGIRCKHKVQLAPHKPGEECGAWLYVVGSIGWRVVTGEDGRERIELGEQVYVAEVTRNELRHIREGRMSAGDALTMLGLARSSMLRRC